MSQGVKRFCKYGRDGDGCKVCGVSLDEDPDGEYVLHSAYAALLEEKQLWENLARAWETDDFDGMVNGAIEPARQELKTRGLL